MNKMSYLQNLQVEDPKSWELYRHVGSLGRFTYFGCIVFCCMLLSVGLIPDAGFIHLVIFFILSSIFGAWLQIKNFVFNNIWVSIFYRLLFIVAIGMLMQFFFFYFGGVHLVNFYKAFGAVFLLSWIIGFCVSIPFKLISIFLGYLEFSDIYGLRIPDDPYSYFKKPVNYKNMNRLQLTQALKKAVDSEDFEEADKIQKFITNKDDTDTSKRS
jgi:hypothetical protein